MLAATRPEVGESPLPEGRPVFILAHPAHELRLFGWLKRTRPIVQVVTRGSRSGVDSERLATTTALVAEAGGASSRAFEPMLDRDLYADVMASNATTFHDMVDRFRDMIVDAKAGWVVTDAWQFYNVSHDLTHLAARVAAAEAARRLAWPVPVFDYDVVPARMGLPRTPRPPLHMIVLDRETLAAKKTAARAFPEIGAELAEIVALEGEASIGSETLRLPLPFGQLKPPAGETPPYETYGEQRVAAGLYASALRWAHAKPVAQSLIDRYAAGTPG